MSWGEIFLGVIALATLVTAALQVGAAVAVARIAREARQTLGDARQAIGAVREDVRPILARVTAIAEDAHRTTSGVADQVEKVDQLVTDLTRRIDETSVTVQRAILTPAREGIALMAALKAGFAALRRADAGPGHGRHAEDEDPLFIG